tara:strand:+ start:12902 stop:13147 length:246 start_codon:yes stop_codon:yes gene_type:complete
VGIISTETEDEGEIRFKRWLELLKNSGFSDHIEYFNWRNPVIYKKREAGRSFKDIGEDYGISATRARQIYIREQKAQLKDA